MPFPPLQTIAEIGSRINSADTTEGDAVDRVISSALGFSDSIARDVREALG